MPKGRFRRHDEYLVVDCTFQQEHVHVYGFVNHVEDADNRIADDLANRFLDLLVPGRQYVVSVQSDVFVLTLEIGVECEHVEDVILGCKRFYGLVAAALAELLP